MTRKPWLEEEQHLRVPVVGRQRPAVAEHDGLTLAPVLVEDLNAVLGGDRGHDAPRFGVEFLGWHTQPVASAWRSRSSMPSRGTARSQQCRIIAPDRATSARRGDGRDPSRKLPVTDAAAPAYIGGTSPSLPTVMRAALRPPSACCVAPRNTWLPTLSSEASPGARVTIGASGGTISSFLPSL